MRFSICGKSSPKMVMRVMPARRALHEGGEIGAEQIAARIARNRWSCIAAPATMKELPKRIRLAGLGVAVVGHVLRADRAHVRRDVLVEQRPGAGDVVRHHELADELVLVGKAVRDACRSPS